jgi:glycosyltransferase involved in cell wall biosynthesis
MPDLKNKTILIISPQAWGKMFVSKHHYAIELAKRGNKVYFLNPPDQVKIDRVEPIEIKASSVYSSLYFVEHSLFFPYRLKFRALPIFHWLMRFHIQKLQKKIKQPIDIVWSFDLGNLYPLHMFGMRPYKIFHPVDEPLNPPAIQAAKGADIIFSVTNEILAKYSLIKVAKHFINHGVAEDFLTAVVAEEINNPIRVGFSGNLLRNDIDREVLLKVIDENQQCVFEFWGSYSTEQSNIGGEADAKTREFIGALQVKNNVILHGAVPAIDLAVTLRKMDAFLICYDVQRDQSKGTNYHKVMEYLATGKVIVSNNITTYRDKPDLIQMVLERNTNEKLPELFKTIVCHIGNYNSKGLMQQRIGFALSNTYHSQLDRIESLTNEA